MTEVQALALLKGMVAAGDTPELDDETVEALLDSCALKDAEGRTPDDLDWEPTYNLNAAAYQGWTLKAAKAAGMIDFSADGHSFKRSGYIEHCLTMQAHYKKAMTPKVYTINTCGRCPC